jgi:hypothetical protein
VPEGLGGLRVAQCSFEQGPVEGERRAELVGGAGNEAPLSIECGLEPSQEVVKSRGEVAELVVRAVEAQPFVQAGSGDPAGRRGNHPHWPQHPAGDQPAESSGQNTHQAQRHGGPDQQLAHVEGVQLRGLGLHLAQLGRGKNRRLVPAGVGDAA